MLWPNVFLQLCWKRWIYHSHKVFRMWSAGNPFTVSGFNKRSIWRKSHSLQSQFWIGTSTNDTLEWQWQHVLLQNSWDFTDISWRFPGEKQHQKKQEFSNPGTRSESSFRRRSLENLPGAGPAGRCCWRHQWVLTVDRGWLMGCIKKTCRNIICYGWKADSRFW